MLSIKITCAALTVLAGYALAAPVPMNFHDILNRACSQSTCPSDLADATPSSTSYGTRELQRHIESFVLSSVPLFEADADMAIFTMQQFEFVPRPVRAL